MFNLPHYFEQNICSKAEHNHKYPKDGELYLCVVKLGETLMNAIIVADVQIVHET
jgi:hypothetical protein